jgi:hypothetical protein
VSDGERVDLVRERFARAERRIDPAVRVTLLVEGHPDIAHRRDRNAVEQIRDVREVPQPRVYAINKLWVRPGATWICLMICVLGLVEADVGGTRTVGIAAVARHAGREPLDQREYIVARDEPIEKLTGAEVDPVQLHAGLLTFECRLDVGVGFREVLGAGRPVLPVDNMAGNSAQRRGLDVHRERNRAVLRHGE